MLTHLLVRLLGRITHLPNLLEVALQGSEG